MEKGKEEGQGTNRKPQKRKGDRAMYYIQDSNINRCICLFLLHL
jgi:hypothetical protein